MIPINLTFQAFGPYVKKQEVDFQKFADSGVFLIHGNTGSGKTTILDAMTYALYGKSSGGQRGDITSMRCQMAQDSLPTEVEFIFKVSKRTYKFTRTIKIKTKKNGSKDYNVSQNAMYLNEEGIFVPFFENPKIREVENKACELIGLNHEQFIQVIMLPQGKFEKLLMAKSDEKEQILVTLFNAEKWQEVAEWICNEAKNIAREITVKRENINILIKSENAQSIEELQNKVQELKEVIKKTSKEKNNKAEILAEEKNKLQLQTDIYNLFEERVKTEQELSKIKEKEEAIHALARKLEKGRKALIVSTKYASVLNIYKLHQEAVTKLKEEEKNNLNLISTQENIEKSLDSLRRKEAYVESLKENKIKYEALIEVYKGITTAKAEFDNETIKLNKLKTEYENKQKIYESSKENLKKLTEKKEFVFNNYSLKLPTLKEKFEKFTTIDKKVAELNSLNSEIEKIDQALTKLNLQLDENKKNTALKKNEYALAYDKYIEETAYLLSLELKEGTECPVCGSTHHPKKAVKSSGSSDSSMIKQLSSELDLLTEKNNEIINLIAKQEAAKSSKLQMLKNLKEEIATLKKDVSDTSKEKVIAELKEAQTEISKLDQIIKSESDLSLQANKLDKELSELNNIITVQNNIREEKSAKYNSLCSQKIDGIDSENDLLSKINLFKKEIEQYTNELNSLIDKKNQIEKMLSASNSSLQFLKDDVENKNKEYEVGKAEYHQLLKDNNFADTAEFKSFLVTQDILDDWDKQIQNYIIEKGTVIKNLERLIELTKNKTKPNIIEIKKSIVDIENIITELEKQIALNSDRKARIEKIIKKAEKDKKLLEEMIKKYDMYNSFGVLLRGDKGISLRRYVLGVMLTSVTIEANKLLKNVHDGRYQLCRTLEGSGRSRKAGLELEVFDAYSGEKRNVAGLSGGEKFLVSLALSLGLSAVVQAQSGGIRIDTMFIDEGFGSLDSSSINDALNILSSVKGSKRLVGIISHVQMLKESIETSISVKKDRTGSVLVINN